MDGRRCLEHPRLYPSPDHGWRRYHSHLSLIPDRFRILTCSVGGGFGTKLDVSLQPFIGLVTLKTRLPSRMSYSRSESMASTMKRHPAEIHGRIACDAQGRITAIKFAGHLDTGPCARWGPTVANRVPVHATGDYFAPNIHATARAIHTNGPVSGAFRGFGVPLAAVWQETLLDQLAEKTSLDRPEFRLLNALRDGQTAATGQFMRTTGIAQCLTALRPHWLRELADAKAPNRGVGLALYWHGCGNTALPNPSTRRIGMTPQGQIVPHQGAADIGQGSDTVIAQIAADALGVPVSALALIGPDTFQTPDAGKASASRQTFVTGRAAYAAGRALSAIILQLGNRGDGAQISVSSGQPDGKNGSIRRMVPL